VAEATAHFEEVKIPLPEPVHDLEAVTGVVGIPEWWPTGSRVSVVLAQGQRSDDALLQALQQHLTERRYLTLRFCFPFLEAGRKKPDPMPVLQRTYASALATLGRDPSAAPAHVFIGGQNLGALATAYAATARVRVEGLFFLGYPLHKQDDPSDVRAERLFRIVNPMLFVQGSRDRHCDLTTLRRTLSRVGAPVQLHVVEEADHAFRVGRRSGRTADDVRTEVTAALEAWIAKVLGE
jgi:uncharacterized protein